MLHYCIAKAGIQYMLNKYLWNEEMKRIPKLLQTISMELDDPSLSSSKYPQPEVHKNKTNINS